MTGRTDRAEARSDAPPEAVWAALTDPARVALWLPPEGMTAEVEAWEARPAGALRATLVYGDASGAPGKSAADRDAVTGRFAAADPPRRLVWETAFEGAGPDASGTMTMVWTLSPDGSGTRIAVEARDVPPAISAEDHAEGLAATLRQLAAEALRR